MRYIINNLGLLLIFLTVNVNNSFAQYGDFCDKLSMHCQSEIIEFAQGVIESYDGNCWQFGTVQDPVCESEEYMYAGPNTKLRIGSLNGPTAAPPQLSVTDGIIGKGLKVCTGKWCDYVFDSDYNLLSLEDVQCFIEENAHLPGFKSEKEMVKEGAFGLKDITIKQQEKIEELFLYAIELNKEVEALLAKKE